MLKFPEYTRREYHIPSWIEWTVAALCVAVGAFVALYFGKPDLDRARASTRWLTTRGKVEVSEVGRKIENNGQIRYFTQIRYSYSVGDRRYESKTVWVGDDFFSSRPGSHEDIVRRYPVNSNVTVHYDPSYPQVAVLEPGLFLSNYGVFVAGLGFIGAGVWVALKALRESQKRRRLKDSAP